MFYGDSVQDTRAQFFISWGKYTKNLPLTTLESQIAAVIAAHPEYHSLFEKAPEDSDKAFSEGANPYMHLGLHLAIRDQIHTDRPMGIRTIYHQLLKTLQDPLEVEHRMMETLAACLWEAQRTGHMPAQESYLNALRAL